MSMPSYFTWSMAEELAVGHMRAIGFTDAKRTKSGADGGLDVVSSQAVAQVKHHAAPIGIAEIQRHSGIAGQRRRALFYSSSGYTNAALQWANDVGMALFTFTVSNQVRPANGAARSLSGHAPAEAQLPEGPDAWKQGTMLTLRRWAASQRRISERLEAEYEKRFPTFEIRDAKRAEHHAFYLAATALKATTDEIYALLEDFKEQSSDDWITLGSKARMAILKTRRAMRMIGLELDDLMVPNDRFIWNGSDWERVVG